MEIVLYSNKQILGGFVLIIIIALLFIVNITLNNVNTRLNLTYFISPLIFTICVISILYISAMNKSIKNTLDKYVLPDTFNIMNCPEGYTKKVYGNNIQCEAINPTGLDESGGSESVSESVSGSVGESVVKV